MSRRQTFFLAFGLALAAAWPAQAHANAATASDTAVRIRSVDLGDYPKVAMTVSITGASVSSDDVRVTEEGRTVSGVDVQALQDAGQDVDVALVVDASNSMEGAPLAAAIAAALKFVTTLPSDQPIEVAIVTFAEHPKVVQSLSDDTSSVLQALGSVTTSQGTALYDAVAEASKLFPSSGQHNIVLLSDGGDRSSKGSLRDAVDAARSSHTAVFAIGLKSPDTDPKVLQSLAKSTGGSYATARTADLSTIYQSLASQLSHQFVVTYTSEHTSGGQVAVGVRTGDATDSALVLEPKVAPPPTAGQPAGQAHPFLANDTGLLVLLGSAFLALFVLMLMLFGARARKQRDHELVRRVAQAPEPHADAASDREHGLANWIPEPVVQAGERVAEAAGMGAKIELMLERSGLPVRPGEFVSGVALAGLAGALVGGVLLHNPVFMLLIGVAAAAVPVVWVRIKVRKRNQKLHSQLADILMILASSLRAGHGFFSALDLVAKEIGEPGAKEFGRVVAEVRLGRPVDEALNAMAERVGSDDFRWAVLGVNIQREVGGNLAEILDTIADTVRERDAVRRQVQVLSSEGRLSIGILAALPFFVSLYIAKVNPGYLNLLFSTRIGLIMVVTACCLLCVGIFWMRKIVNIDV